MGDDSTRVGEITLIKKILILLLTLNTFLSLYADNTESSGDTITWTLAEESWIPIYYDLKGSDSSLQGYWPELIRELFINRLSLDLKVKRLPWVRGQRQVREGESDFMITIPTDERESYALVSENPVLRLFMQIFTYAGHERMDEIKKIVSVQDILQMGLIPVTNQGNGWHEQHIDSFGVKTEHVRSDESLPKVLASKRADILIDVPLTMSYQIKQLGLSSQIVLTDVILDETDFHLLVSKKSPFADKMDEIDRVLNEMIEDGTVDKLYRKYVSME